MIEFYKISFVLIMAYLVFLILPILKAGMNYDIEKKKISGNYNEDHIGISSGFRGRLPIPWQIKDTDPRMARYVDKYNKLTKIFWYSYGIGIPLLIIIGTQLNAV
jgi:hypothetical protein